MCKPMSYHCIIHGATQSREITYLVESMCMCVFICLFKGPGGVKPFIMPFGGTGSPKCVLVRLIEIVTRLHNYKSITFVYLSVISALL